ncbi:24755_t:CDS:2, partial [Racocetra persica]
EPLIPYKKPHVHVRGQGGRIEFYLPSLAIKKDDKRTVIGLKNAKTATVELVTNRLHDKYRKLIKSKKKIQAHNEEHELKLGDKVIIKSSRPYSATKRFL